MCLTQTNSVQILFSSLNHLYLPFYKYHSFSLSHLVFGTILMVFSFHKLLFFYFCFTVKVKQLIGNVSSQIRMKETTGKDGKRVKVGKRAGWAADTFPSWAIRAQCISGGRLQTFMFQKN